MTKEEQLRIYSAYLPYKLKLGFEGDDIEYLLVGVDLSNEGLQLISSFGDFGRSEIDVPKPILYDLSYLTKEIEHEVEVITPIVELAKIGTREENCYVTNGNIGTCYVDAKYQKKGFFIYHPDGYFLWQVGKNAEPLTVWDQHKLFQKLYEWHFNVFSLPEGEYINKATLTN